MKIPKQNIIDKAIAFVNPQAGLRRLEARTRLSMLGGWTGARKDRRQTSQWQVSDGSADNVTLDDLPELRSRSRDLLRNAPLAVGAVNTVVTNVIGTGLIVRSNIDREVLSRYFANENEFDKWERQAERLFRHFSESTDCDVTRTQTFYELQNLILRSCLESGDVFVIKRYVERPNSLLGVCLQVVEADRVANPDLKENTSRLKGGVELDENGAPVAYYVYDGFPNEYGEDNSKYQRIPAFAEDGSRQVLHIMCKTRPGLTRGVPYLAPVIESLKQLDRYSEAEIMSAVISAMFTVFVKTENDEGLAPMTPFEGSGAVTDDKDYKLGPGAILDLQPNETIEIADPKRPNQAFDPFVQAVLRQIGVALEIPFEILIKHFTSSYSAAQAALVEAWKFFSSRRKWLAIQLCKPVYEMVISEGVAKGLIQAPHFFKSPLIREAFLSSEWVGPPRGQIDQLKEIKAAEKRLEIGISSLAEETAQLTGGDWERKHFQIVKEHNMRKELK